MIPRFFALAIACFSVTACDKAKNLISSTKEKLAGAAAKASAEAEKADPALQALVDQTPEGVHFRKDLPFPAKVDVRVVQVYKFKNARVIQKSELGPGNGVLTTDGYQTTRFERSGDQVKMTCEVSETRKPVDPAKPDAPPEVEKDDLVGKSANFRRDGKSWKADATTDFKVAFWSREVAPGLNDLLTESAVLPRVQWFGKNRVKIGDTIPLSGESLTVLFDSRTTGAVTLKLESIAATAGHPCGVFSITGSFKRKSVPKTDGTAVDEEVTIESGKIWLSLIHPIVIREELETIQTLVTGSKGGVSTRIQGAISVSSIREWKAL